MTNEKEKPTGEQPKLDPRIPSGDELAQKWAEELNEQDAAAFESVMAMYESKAFTAEDRKHATKEGYEAFRYLLRKRLLSDKPLPTVPECEGMVILALDFLTSTPGRPESPYGRGQF